MIATRELCCYCEKRSATKAYEEVRGGKTQTNYYCFRCFERLFLAQDESFFDGLDKPTNSGVCLDCGLTAQEFFKTGLVGCANCYRYLKKEIYPSILKMQGDRAHCGKGSQLIEERERLVEKRNEAKRLVDVYLAERNYDGAQEQMSELKRLNALLYGEGV